MELFCIHASWGPLTLCFEQPSAALHLSASAWRFYLITNKIAISCRLFQGRVKSFSSLPGRLFLEFPGHTDTKCPRLLRDLVLMSLPVKETA